MAGERRLPVVFVPGGVLPAELSYGKLLPELGDQVDFVLKDLEVYAGDVPPADYELGLEAEAIEQAADDAGFDTFHLVGYSGGGASALVFTAGYPDRVRSLALVEPAWIGNEGWTTDEAAYWQKIALLMTLQPDERMEGFARLNTGSGKVIPRLGPQPDWMAKRPAGLEAMTRAFERSFLDVESLRNFHRPVYVAVGGLSHPAERDKAERLSSVFPDIQVEVYQDRHHMDPPQRAEAARFARALHELWRRAGWHQAGIG
ncbi:MAG TPA: alpha/beta hydrolase [Chloroflexota bacterium]|nr:alpha/beta hydrolase [Chloroflexota bacterium]